jgi:hypothetical protein
LIQPINDIYKNNQAQQSPASQFLPDLHITCHLHIVYTLMNYNRYVFITLKGHICKMKLIGENEEKNKMKMDTLFYNLAVLIL